MYYFLQYELFTRPLSSPGFPKNKSFCLRDVWWEGDVAWSSFPCGFARRGPGSAPALTLPTDGDRTEKRKPAAPAGLICSDKAVPGNRYPHDDLQPRADAGGERAEPRSPRDPTQPSPTAPPLRNVGCEKGNRRNKPVSVLSYTRTLRREPTIQTCERGWAHRAESCRLRESHTHGEGEKRVCGRETR